MSFAEASQETYDGGIAGTTDPTEKKRSSVTSVRAGTSDHPLGLPSSFLPQLTTAVEMAGEGKPWEEIFRNTMEEWVGRHEAALFELVTQQQHMEQYLKMRIFKSESAEEVRTTPSQMHSAKEKSEHPARRSFRRLSVTLKNPFRSTSQTPRKSHSSSKGGERSVDTEGYADEPPVEEHLSEPPATRKDFEVDGSLGELFRPIPTPRRTMTSRKNKWEFMRKSSRSAGKWIEDTGVKISQNYVLEQPLECTKRVQQQVRRLVQSATFDIVCALLIVSNAVLVGIETEAESGSMTADDSTDTVAVFQFLLNLWFIAELLLRIIADGHRFLVSQDWRWNWFDAFLVATSVLDIFTTGLDVGGLQMGRVFRAVRLFRIVRTLRIVRMLQYIREFRKMVFSLMASVQTLIWSLLLLFFVIYMYGIWFTQGASEVLRSGEVEGTDDEVELRNYYGSLGKSFYSLFMAIFNGKSWGLLMDPLLSTDTMMAIQFISFICISLLGVMNVVTAVFVDSAMQSTQHYKDLLVQEKMAAKETFARHVKSIFHQIDKDGDGRISAAEPQNYIEDETMQLQTYFEALELNPSDTFALFKLMDPDDSGDIDIEEFCDGCTRLQGGARSFDVNCIIYEQKRQIRMIENFVKEFRGRFDHLACHQEWLEGATLKMWRPLHRMAPPPAPRSGRSGLVGPPPVDPNRGITPAATPGKFSRTLPSALPPMRGNCGSGVRSGKVVA